MNLPANEIICGDNVETLQTFPADSIDLTVTSPPYDNLRTYGGHSWDFEGVAQQLWRVTKSGGVVVWVVGDSTTDGDESGESFRQALYFKSVGFRLHDTMIWSRLCPFPESVRYHPSFEYMFILSVDAPATVNLIKDRATTTGGAKSTSRMERQPDGTNRRPDRKFTRNEIGSRLNIWNNHAGWGQSTKDKNAFNHPAIFPESLARDHILSWSNEGDTVLDPFSGSGTTAKMAKLMGRKYIGVEVNQEYCDIAENRLAQGVFDFST